MMRASYRPRARRTTRRSSPRATASPCSGGPPRAAPAPSSCARCGARLPAGRPAIPRGGQTYYTAYTSPDGSTWTAIPGSTQALAMTGPRAGRVRDHLAQPGHRLRGHPGLGGGQRPAKWPRREPAPAPGAAATSARSAPRRAASTLSGGTWTVQGGGGDIWGTADDYVPLRVPVAGRRRQHQRRSHLAERHRSVGQGGADDAGHHRPGLAVLRGPGHPGQRRRGPVADRAGRGDQPGHHPGSGAGLPEDHPDRDHVRRVHLPRRDHLDPGARLDPDPGQPVSGTLLRGFAVTSHNTGEMGTAVFNSVQVSP